MVLSSRAAHSIHIFGAQQNREPLEKHWNQVAEMRRELFGNALLTALIVASPAPLAASEDHSLRKAQDVTVTILSSNLANGATVGEWGLSAFVEVDGQCVLFDAGRYPDTVLRNAGVLGVDLSCVTDVVLSHFHFDHNTGLLPLLRDLREKNPSAIQRVHVAEGFFLRRQLPQGDDYVDWNQMIAVRDTLEAAGVEIIEHSGPTEILPSVWVTGPVERVHDEQEYGRTRMLVDGEWVQDYVPESQGLSVLTDEGHIVLLGCGHSGVVNALEHVQATIEDAPIHALMGGLHLFNASDEMLGWTADRLRSIRVEHLMAGHCTGIEPLLRLRIGLNLNRRTAVVGAVGSQFVLGEGIRATSIAM
jgi:7,8-dihydropterin-6-yl-methyl-4-(beta-D-ribofuranosyl)aminobenzene 5'-phosphate synthase